MSETTLAYVERLADQLPVDVPSAAEIRSQVNKYLPPEVKLSSLVTALREE